MAEPGKAFRVGAVVWALVLGALVVVLGGSILLPSTKRARLHFQMPDTQEAQTPTTLPTTQP